MDLLCGLPEELISIFFQLQTYKREKLLRSYMIFIVSFYVLCVFIFITFYKNNQRNSLFLLYLFIYFLIIEQPSKVKPVKLFMET